MIGDATLTRLVRGKEIVLNARRQGGDCLLSVTGGDAPHIGAAQRQIQLVEQVFELDVAGLVDDQPQRTARAVLAHVHHTFAKKFIVQTGHGDQEVVGQVEGDGI